MWKRLLVVSAVSAAMSSMALAAPLTVGFSQVGSESGWRAAETNVAKSEAEKRGITLKIADGQQKQENQIKRYVPSLHKGWMRSLSLQWLRRVGNRY